MTPRILKYGKINKNVSYELSYGKGLFDEPLYGVTVVSEEKGLVKREYDISQAFPSREAAEQYIRELKAFKSIEAMRRFGETYR